MQGVNAYKPSSLTSVTISKTNDTTAMDAKILTKERKCRLEYCIKKTNT